MTATALRQWHLTVHGAPRTKKTSNQFVIAGGRRLMMPSKAWRDWCKNAEIHGPNRPLLPSFSPDSLFNCCALFYRDARRGDAVGFYQGLADLLEKRGIIPNDRQIVSWDGSRLLVDRDNPRVEATLVEQL